MEIETKQKRIQKLKYAPKKGHKLRWPKSGLQKYAADLIAYRKVGMTLRKMEKSLQVNHGVRFSHTTISRYLKKLIGK